jgi:hypothetical protein
MHIEYQIKRLDLIKSFFYTLQHSRRTQLFVFGAAILIGAYILFRRYSVQHLLKITDFMIASGFMLGYILLIPVFSFITVKTQIRKLTITPAGIETQIGSQSGKIAWKSIDAVVASRDSIFITGKNANIFTIPSGAFATHESRNEFIELATRYHQESRSLSE